MHQATYRCVLWVCRRVDVAKQHTCSEKRVRPVTVLTIPFGWILLATSVSITCLRTSVGTVDMGQGGVIWGRFLIGHQWTALMLLKFAVHVGEVEMRKERSEERSQEKRRWPRTRVPCGYGGRSCVEIEDRGRKICEYQSLSWTDHEQPEREEEKDEEE